MSLVWLVILAGVFALWPAKHTSADVNDFEINSFDATYDLDKSNPHGHMKVEEKIQVDFHDFNHGILRAIPETYKGHSLHVKVQSVKDMDGAERPYTTYTSSQNLVLKIGDPNNTVTGHNFYDISYSLDGPITFYSDHDELFWDINGDQWGQTAAEVKATFNIADKITLKTDNGYTPRCYTGSFGSTAVNCTVNYENPNLINAATTQPLNSHETLSVVLAFPAGTFAKYTLLDKLLDDKIGLVLIAAVILAFIVAFRTWWRYGKDFKGRGVVVPEYEPPKNFDPPRAGTLWDYNFDGKDLTASIINMAINGYIQIVESTEKKRLRRDTEKTILVLKKNNFEGLSQYEVMIMNALFPGQELGATKELGKNSSKLADILSKINKGLDDDLSNDGYFDGNPRKTRFLTIVLPMTATLLITWFSFKHWHYFVGIIGLAALVAMGFLAAKMPRRTKLGQDTLDQLKGLKLYIETAEKDRIKMMQSPNAPYAANASEPTRTVNLFEKLLPYAIIFGVEKQWAEQFKDIYTQPPDWYQGNWSAFNTGVLVSHLNSSSQALNASFAAPSSSGGSGFGGGGAGGGGGGGGGGGW